MITVKDNTVIGGIGKLYFEHGLPISMAIDKLKRKGYKIDLMSIIKECKENGWSEKTVRNKLRADFIDGGFDFSEVENVLNGEAK